MVSARMKDGGSKRHTPSSMELPRSTAVLERTEEGDGGADSRSSGGDRGSP
jgi:hypothetical protein